MALSNTALAFDCGAERHQLVQVVIAEVAREQYKRWAQPFAASFERVVQHPPQRRELDLLDRFEQIFDEDHVLGDWTVQRLRRRLRHAVVTGSRAGTRKRRQALAVVASITR
jgi:hypothetical protein